MPEPMNHPIVRSDGNPAVTGIFDCRGQWQSPAQETPC